MKTVVLSIVGGCLAVDDKPEDVEVVAYDYDVEGLSDLPTDPDGRPCQILRWPSKTDS